MISVVLLSLNEGSNLIRLCNEIIEIMSKHKIEIIIVEDGSDTELLSVVSTFAIRNKLKLLHRENPNGLAGAIVSGIKLAEGERIVVLDGDGTHDPLFIPKLVEASSNNKFVIASRFVKGGEMVHPWQRQTSKIFNLFIMKFLKTGVKDNLGGYFSISTAVALKFANGNVFSGHGDYFLRMVLEARKMNYEIIEIPSVFRLRFSGKPTRSRWWMLRKYLRTVLELKRRNK